MKTLSIIFHSQSGNTRKMAEAILEGASKEADIKSELLSAFDATIETLAGTDLVIFGTPENFGYMSGALKDFFDRTYDLALERHIRPGYALFVSAGNDGSNAVREIRRIMKGYNMTELAEPVIATKGIRETDLEKCRELGHTLAAGLSLGIF